MRVAIVALKCTLYTDALHLHMMRDSIDVSDK